MSTVNYQTIKLSWGKHKSPDDGACVMELASMLGGEPFSDHPISVSPVIGAFLRAYNDALDPVRRQDLYAYASKVVGSRASESVERARLERLLVWAKHRRGQRRTRRLAPTWLREVFDIPKSSIAITLIEVARGPRPTDKGHAEVLALIDELLAIGTHEGSETQGGDGSMPLAEPAASF